MFSDEEWSEDPIMISISDEDFLGNPYMFSYDDLLEDPLSIYIKPVIWMKGLKLTHQPIELFRQPKRVILDYYRSLK